MFAGAVATQVSDCQPRGYLAIVNAMQGSDETQVIRAKVFRRAAEGHKLFVSRFERARAEGDLPDSVDPEGLARLLGTVVQGIMTLGAAGGSERELRALADSMLALWPTPAKTDR